MDSIAEWRFLHQYYQGVKLRFHLTAGDIFKQLSFPYHSCHLQYLCPSGFNRVPSNKCGTIGRKIRDILKSGLIKTMWLPSVAEYKDKLLEFCSGHESIQASFVKFDCILNQPEIRITIYVNETCIPTNGQLQRLFTIDNTIPIIAEISLISYL